jgi:hypothetical protein
VNKRLVAPFFSAILFVLGLLAVVLQQGLILFGLAVLLFAVFWQGMVSSRHLSVISAIPLGALTVFAVTVPISIARAIFIEGGLTRTQGVIAGLITLFVSFLAALWQQQRSGKRVIFLRQADLVPLSLALLVVALGLISTFANRVTALAIFMAGGDHANHVGRAVSILNAGAAGSVERLAYLRPGGLNPFHFLAAELFTVQGGGASFSDAADFYLFFSRFEWLQLGIWVLTTGIAAQAFFLCARPIGKKLQNVNMWGLHGAALLGIVLLALPFVSSTGLLGFSTSVAVAWVVLTPAVLFTLSDLKFRTAAKFFITAVLVAALVAISIRSSNALQVLVFPAVALAIFISKTFFGATKRPKVSLRTIALSLIVLAVVALFARVLVPYIYVFASAGNPTGTSEEPSFWLLSALILILLLGFSLRANTRSANWMWSWVWASVFGLLFSMVFLTLRFGSTPNDPDYLVSKTLFAAVAFVLPFTAGLLMALVVSAAQKVSLRAVRVSVIVLPVAILLLMRPDSAWSQVFTAWNGGGHPMTWYSAPFAKGLPENAYAFSLSNRDAAWLASLSFEAYAKPTLAYDVLTRPDPVFGPWDQDSLCNFIERNDVKVMVTDGFGLQGALTDCPAASGVSYVVPPRGAK